MNMLHLSWLLARPVKNRLAPQILTVSAYAILSAILLIVLGGAHSFTTFEAEAQGTYVPLAALAVVLLVIPLLVLGASAARLSARANDRALSSLRLLGATGGQVSILAVLQAVGTALVGTLAGVMLYFACAPLASLIRFQGAPIGAAIYLPVWIVAIAVFAVVIIAAISAVAGLRKLVITPLAVATRRTVPVPSWKRALITVGSIGVLYLVFSNLGSVAQEMAVLIVVIVAGLGFGLLVLNLVGPYLVSKVGASKLKKASSPQQLLAARMILESPTESWRQVSGVAMASFVAVVGGSGAAMMKLTESEVVESSWYDYLPGDILTGVLVTLAITFICVAASSANSQSAATLDRADLYTGLNRLGMEWSTVNAARTKSLMIPALSAAIGFAVASTILVLPLAGMAVITSPLTVLTIIGAVGLGLVMIRVSILVADPAKLVSAGE
ncbi:FtsX-like permease family protein [Glutamicibacter sp. JC586]|uniref:FtsX-like permease family protein n=1 Tax=Glutamicibacter sp. JC586 TaxID=2590552 RepID=UPI00135B2CCB|nr:FtsX-like permease family protein [Glutamicibacter sp. JC586]